MQKSSSGAKPASLPPMVIVTSEAVLSTPGSVICGGSAPGGLVSLPFHGALVMFAIVFFWQFPHFWAIAWIAHKDYTAAGFKLLPSTEGPTKYSAIQAVIYSLLLLPVGILPYLLGMSGIVSLVIVAVRYGSEQP